MADAFLQLKHRDFNPLAAAGLSQETRDSVNAALKAMSDWRNEITETNEKNGKRVIEKMSAAAAALGWPDRIVDAARAQLQGIAATQAKALDQLMDTWEVQIKLPNPMSNAPSATLNTLKSAPGLVPGGWPGAGDFQTKDPMQFWLQFAEQWQKAWADMMTKAIDAGKPR